MGVVLALLDLSSGSLCVFCPIVCHPCHAAHMLPPVSYICSATSVVRICVWQLFASQLQLCYAGDMAPAEAYGQPLAGRRSVAHSLAYNLARSNSYAVVPSPHPCGSLTSSALHPTVLSDFEVAPRALSKQDLRTAPSPFRAGSQPVTSVASR